MKVAFINSTSDTFTPSRSGAIGTVLWELCKSARKEGIEPLVISRSSSVPSYDWKNSVLLDYPYMPTFKGAARLMRLHKKLSGWGHPRQGAYVGRVFEAVRQSGADKMPIFLQNDIELAVALRNEFPRAFIHHHAQNDNPADWRFRRRFARSVDRATAVSDFTASWNARFFGVKVGTLHNGVDIDRFHPGPQPHGGELSVINFVGRTDHAKAPDLVLKAALRLAKKGRKFGLQILGTTHYGFTVENDFLRELRELSEEVEKAGIPVRRPGWIERDKLPDELRLAHIHVVPSRWNEPCALTIMEGMASGLAVVASRTGGTPELVGDAGLLFDRDSVDQLADHLDRLIADAEYRGEVCRRCRQRAEQFSWDEVWRQLKQLLNQRN